MIETTIETCFPAKPMRQLYNKDVLEEIGYDMICLMKVTSQIVVKR